MTTTEIYLIIAAMIVPALAQGYVMLTYSRYKKESNAFNISGFEVARKILDESGLDDMYIVESKGTLSDHYDPTRKTVKLSPDVFHGKTTAAAAIAAHECGHAIQDKDGYAFMRVRSAIFPVVNLGTRFAYIVLILSFLLASVELLWVAIGLVALGLLFQLVTLPVEFDASKRAKALLRKYNLADEKNIAGTSAVLTAAAMTYLAGVLATSLEMVRLILIANRRR